MIELIIKFGVVIGCGELWYWGGQPRRAYCRDTILPIILGTYIGVITNWWIGVLTVGAYNMVRIGYGIPDSTDEGSWLGRIFKTPWLVRGVAGGLYAIMGLSFYTLFTQQFILYIMYVVGVSTINAVAGQLGLKIEVEDRMRGLILGSIIFFI